MPEQVEICTPAGISLRLCPEDPQTGDGWASCAVRKDSGDDPDSTNRVLVYAKAEKGAEGDITIEGGEGVGRVTKAGLDQPVGAAAINSTPLRMIRENAAEARALFGWTGPLRLIISIPGGEELARKTFNPMLGISGGISILGTTGIVEPMSDEGYIGAIRSELSVLRAAGERKAIITPGNYGMAFLENGVIAQGNMLNSADGAGERLRDALLLPGLQPVKCSNYIGESLAIAGEFGFRHLLLVGHIGKLMKLAAGNFNTHSRYGDGRRELFAAFAGAEGAERRIIAELLDCATSEAAIDLLREAGVWEPVLARLLAAIEKQLERRTEVETGAVLFSQSHGFLGMTGTARRLILQWKEIDETPIKPEGLRGEPQGN
jgi:cobalt-precorrin-5B (C1)-methyltransferase